MGNIRVTHSASTDNARAESAVVINPNNPQQMVAASKMFEGLHEYHFTLKTAFSVDGGQTWNESDPFNLPLDATVMTDPAMAWDDSGNVFMLGLACKNPPKCDNVGMTVYKSTNGGQTWGDPRIIHTSPGDDKQWMAGDTNPNSPHHGNLYAAWDDTGGLRFARSLDHGDTWESILGGTIDNTTINPFSFSPEVNVAADGTVYIVFLVAAVVMMVSTDGGDSFHSMPTVSGFTELSTNNLPSAGGWAVFPGGNFRVITAPTACVVGQTVVVAWDDMREGVSRIYYAVSPDGGSTWPISGQPLLTGVPADLQHFFPQIIADSSGIIFCAFYEFGPKPQKHLIDVIVARSLDGGSTFLPLKITDQPWDPTVNAPWSHHAQPHFDVIDSSVIFIGDYFGIDASYEGVYPVWTDTRDGGLELYTDIVPIPRCAFLIERSSLGEDEIDARRNLPGGPAVPDAFHVIVDGLTAAELGVTNSSTRLDVISPVNGMIIKCTGNKSATAGYGSEVQRFTFNYDLDFPTDDAFIFPNATLPITLNVTTQGLSASGEIELIKQPNPFILHGDPPWLSVDLRVFSVTANEKKFGNTMGADASKAPQYIQNVIADLTAGKGKAGTDFFTDLHEDEANNLFVFETHSNKRVFNFAIARVHYIGTIGADKVRVFFRLFPALSTSTAFQLGTTYRRNPSNPHGEPIPRAGIVGTEYVTIPCFAEQRIDSTVDTMDNQTDDPYNVQHINAGAGGKEVFHFFGCWLDINQPFQPDGVTPNNVLPVHVDVKKDGPFQDPSNKPLPIQQAVIRNPHQCLIAEIAFDNVSINGGQDPSNSDKLAQRNLAWGDLANPGVDGSRRALNTFEVRPTPQALPLHETPDELMIEWGDLPPGTTAQIYLPAVDVEGVLKKANGMYTTHGLTRADNHTIQCSAAEITYIPIPRGTDLNFAGLLSVDFPAGVRRGQLFKVIVKQVTSAFGTTTTPPPGAPLHAATVVKKYPIKWRRVLGAFQVNIPVQTKSLLLPREERLLSVMKWIGEAIPADSRWYPVFNRYLEQLGDRVAGFGGNPDDILPSPDGDGRRSKCDHKLKWLLPSIVAPMMVLMALAPLFWSAPLAALAIVLVLASALYWHRRCKISACDLLSVLILGLSVAYLIIGLLFLTGFRRFGLVFWLALLAVLNGALVLIAAVKRCCSCCEKD
ncbi:MAG TPA: sialidase family protein [Pyrinomonadaceae bacterium]